MADKLKPSDNPVPPLGLKRPSKPFNAADYEPKFQDAKKGGTSLTDTVHDVGIGTMRIPGAATGLVDIPLGLAGFDRPASRAAESLGEATGFQPGKWADEAQQRVYSPERQQADLNVQQAWDEYTKGNQSLGGAIKETLANPRNLAGNVFQSLPGMVAGGAAGKVLSGGSKIAGSLGEGLITAGQQMDQVNPDSDPQKSALTSMAAGIGTGLIGYGGSKVANKLGIIDPDTLLSTGAGATAKQPLSIGKRIGYGAAQEGLFEELPQSMQEQVWQNVAEDKPITEGLAQAGVIGALAGGVMGGGFNIMQPQHQAENNTVTYNDAAGNERTVSTEEFEKLKELWQQNEDGHPFYGNNPRYENFNDVGAKAPQGVVDEDGNIVFNDVGGMWQKIPSGPLGSALQTVGINPNDRTNTAYPEQARSNGERNRADVGAGEPPTTPERQATGPYQGLGAAIGGGVNVESNQAPIQTQEPATSGAAQVQPTQGEFSSTKKVNTNGKKTTESTPNANETRQGQEGLLNPTHITSEGVPVIATDTPNIWFDGQNEIEDNYAQPIREVQNANIPIRNTNADVQGSAGRGSGIATGERRIEGNALDGGNGVLGGRVGGNDNGQPASSYTVDRVALGGDVKQTVQIRDVYGKTHFVLKSDLDNTNKIRLSTFDKSGVKKSFIHRNNILPDQDAPTPYFADKEIIGTKETEVSPNGNMFKNRGAAKIFQTKNKLTDTHDIVEQTNQKGVTGFVLRRKQPKENVSDTYQRMAGNKEELQLPNQDENVSRQRQDVSKTVSNKTSMVAGISENATNQVLKQQTIKSRLQEKGLTPEQADTVIKAKTDRADLDVNGFVRAFTGKTDARYDKAFNEQIETTQNKKTGNQRSAKSIPSKAENNGNVSPHTTTTGLNVNDQPSPIPTVQPSNAEPQPIDRPVSTEGDVKQGIYDALPDADKKVLEHKSAKFWKGETFKDIAHKVASDKYADNQDVKLKVENRYSGDKLLSGDTVKDYTLSDGRNRMKIPEAVGRYIEKLQNVKPEPNKRKADQQLKDNSEGDVKQPWEMTRDEFTDDFWGKTKTPDFVKAGDYYLSDIKKRFSTYSEDAINSELAKYGNPDKKISEYGETYLDTVRKAQSWHKKNPVLDHKAIIEKAIKEGKHVPANVLVDYPDLQPKDPINDQSQNKAPQTPAAEKALDTVESLIEAFKNLSPTHAAHANHSSNVAQTAEEFARSLSDDPVFHKLVKESVLLHDIGKMDVPAELLGLARRTTQEEQAEINKHSNSNGLATKRLLGLADKHTRKMATIVAEHHHDAIADIPGLSKEENTLVQIARISDIFEALTDRDHNRDYRKPSTRFEALEIMLSDRPRHKAELLNGFAEQQLRDYTHDFSKDEQNQIRKLVEGDAKPSNTKGMHIAEAWLKRWSELLKINAPELYENAKEQGYSESALQHAIRLNLDIYNNLTAQDDAHKLYGLQELASAYTRHIANQIHDKMSAEIKTAVQQDYEKMTEGKVSLHDWLVDNAAHWLLNKELDENLSTSSHKLIKSIALKIKGIWARVQKTFSIAPSVDEFLSGLVTDNKEPIKQPSTTQPVETKAEPVKQADESSKAKQIGDQISLMGINSNLAKIKSADGIDYELYNANSLKDKSGFVRVYDRESGNVVSLNKYKTYDDAEKAFIDATKNINDEQKQNSGKNKEQVRLEKLLRGKSRIPGYEDKTKSEAIKSMVEQERGFKIVEQDDRAARKKDSEDEKKISNAIITLASNTYLPVRVQQEYESLEKRSGELKDIQLRLLKNNYKKNEYRVYQGSKTDGGFNVITKPEYDYAQLLIKQNKEQQAEPQSQPKQEEKAPDIKHSKSKPSSGSTVEQIKSWLNRREKKLYDAGILKIAQSSKEVPQTAHKFDAGGVEGFYDPARDELWLIADRLNKNNFESVKAHELMHRAEFKDPKVKAAISRFELDLSRRFNAAGKGLGTPIEQEAYRRVVAANVPMTNVHEEFRAYLVSAYQREPQSFTGRLKKIFDDFVAAIRAFLVRNGFDLGFIKSLTPADLTALSLYGAKIAAPKTSGAKGVMASAREIPETIMVDGKERPTRNSNGKLIHSTEEGIRNFYKWFGESQVVDKQGRPMVVYHGTTADIKEFRAYSHIGTHSTASMFAVKDGSSMYPVYLKMEAPLRIVDTGVQHTASDIKDAVIRVLKLDYNNYARWYSVSEILKDKDYDGLVYKNEREGDGDSYVIINSKQIKSAIGNTGEFNQDNSDIRFSVAPQQKSSLWNRWFGKSKMVSKGEPIKFYRGDAEPITFLDNSKLGSNTNHVTAMLGHFFTRDKGEAYQYGNNVQEFFLSIQNPYVVTTELLDKRMGDDPVKFVNRIKSMGHDGLYLKDIGQAIVFDSSQAKLTSNQSPSFGNDIRFSIAEPETLAEDLANFKQQAPEAVLNKLDSARSTVKKFGLSVLTQRQLVELMSEILPMAKRFSQERNNYDTTESKWHQMGDEIAKRWETLAPGRDKVTWGTGAWRIWKKRNQQAQIALADLMHEMTVSGVDPRKPEPKPTKTNAIEIITHKRLKAQYDALIPEAKKVLNDADKFHKSVTTALIESVSDKITNSEMPEDKKAKLIEEIAAKFNTVKGPYFPLMRFGEYWVASAEGVETFETQRELDKRIAELKKAGARIKGRGKSLDNFNKIEGVDAGFVNKVSDLIDTLDVDKADALKDGIFQLYLAALPEQSMRKRFIHRKGTPGYETDALRSFAKKSFHDGKQLAKLKYAPEMKKVLDDMEEVIKTGNSEARKESLVHRIQLIPEWLDLLDNGMDYGQLEGLYQNDKALFNRFASFKDEKDRAKAMSDYLSHEKYILSQVEAYESEGKRELAADIMTYLHSSYTNMMESNTNPLTNLINQSVFTYFLGFSPSSAIVNYLQTPGVALPLIAGRHGMVQSSKAMADAAQLFFGNKDKDGMHSIRPGLKDENEIKMFEKLTENGTFDRTRSHDLAGFSEEGVQRGTLHRDFMLAATAWFHHAEVANREITALMAYRLEFAKTGNVQQSIEYANDVVNKAHLDYSGSNRPDLFHGNTARVMLQFKMYSQGMTWLWGKTAYDAMISKDATPERKAEARRILMSMIGVQSAMAGVLGLPIGGLLMAAQMLLNMMDDDDEPKDVEVEIQKGLNAVFGPDISRIVSRGILSETGADFHNRLSLADLWIREPDKELEGKDANYYLLKTILGPVAGIGENIFSGMKMIEDGDVQRGWETMLPNSIKGAAKAIRMLEEGGATSMQGNMIYETNAWEKALQSIGFRPSGLAVQQAQNQAIKNRELAIGYTKEKLINKAARYKMHGDNEAFKDTWDDIQDFNKKYPHMQIGMGSIMKSIRSKNAASRDAENGLVVRPKLRFVRDEEDFT